MLVYLNLSVPVYFQHVIVTQEASRSSSATRSQVTAFAWKVFPGLDVTHALEATRVSSHTASAATSASPNGM